MTKTTGLSLGLSISRFYQISQTSSDGIANGRRSPIFKPSGTFDAILLSARAVLPIKSSSALSPAPLKKNQNLKPLKGPLNPQLPISTRQTSHLPTAPVMRHPGARPHPLALPPPNQEAMTPKPQKRFPLPLHGPGPKANTFPHREVVGPEGPTWVHVPFSISHMSQIK